VAVTAGDLTLNQGRRATRPGQLDLAVYQPLRIPVGAR